MGFQQFPLREENGIGIIYYSFCNFFKCIKNRNIRNKILKHLEKIYVSKFIMSG